MLKAEAREIYRKKRMELSEVDKNRFDDLMLINFQTLNLPSFNAILSYWPILKNKEVNTHIFTDFLEFRNPGAFILYPKTNWDEHTMKAIIVNNETEFAENSHFIYEPVLGDELPASEIDLVLVPSLATDKQGYRIGYGKGYYDKYLKDCRKDCIKIGFSYFDPLESIDDRNEFDIPLNYCITPQQIYVF